MNHPSPSGFAQLWAVALLTIREASRRKVFVLLILFTGVVFSCALFFPAVDAEARLRLIQVWSLRATILFTAILAIFVAGFALPEDMEKRRVYTLLTKPVSKVSFFLGRWLGFALLLAIFILIMALLTLIFHRTSKAFGGEKFPELNAFPRYFSSELVPVDAVEHPQITGRWGLRGGSSKEKLVFRFPSVRRADFPEEFRVELLLRVGGMGGLRFQGEVEVQIGEQRRVGTASNQVSFPVLFPRDALPENGPVEVHLRRKDPNILLTADLQSLTLYGASESYEWNYLKGSSLIFLHAVVVMSLTLMATTFLGSPVSLILGIGYFLISLMYGFISDSVKDMDANLKEYRSAIEDGRKPPPIPKIVPPWMQETSSTISHTTLKAIGDFDQLDYAPYLLADRAVPVRAIGSAALLAGIRLGILLLLGMLVMRTKEFT